MMMRMMMTATVVLMMKMMMTVGMMMKMMTTVVMVMMMFHTFTRTKQLRGLVFITMLLHLSWEWPPSAGTLQLVVSHHED